MVEEKDWIVEGILTDRDKYDKNMRCKECDNDKFTMMRSFENNDYYLLSTCIRCGNRTYVDLLQPIYVLD